MSFQSILTALHTKVEALPDAQIDNVLRAQSVWFEWEGDEDPGLDVVLALPREEKIAVIMGADPLFVEGGLVDFLASQGIMVE